MKSANIFNNTSLDLHSFCLLWFWASIRQFSCFLCKKKKKVVEQKCDRPSAPRVCVCVCVWALTLLQSHTVRKQFVSFLFFFLMIYFDRQTGIAFPPNWFSRSETGRLIWRLSHSHTHTPTHTHSHTMWPTKTTEISRSLRNNFNQMDKSLCQ